MPFPHTMLLVQAAAVELAAQEAAQTPPGMRVRAALGLRGRLMVKCMRLAAAEEHGLTAPLTAPSQAVLARAAVVVVAAAACASAPAPPSFREPALHMALAAVALPAAVPS